MNENNEKERTCMLRLKEDTLLRFKKQKRKHSADEYLSLMLNYFEVTEIKPENIDERIVSVFNKGIERIVKIQKAQEKEFFRTIRRDLSDVLREKKTSQSLKDFSDEIGLERELTKEDFLEMGKKVSELESEKKQLSDEVDRLKKDIVSIQEGSNYEDKSVIIGCCRKIHDYLKSGEYDRIANYVDRIVSVCQ